MEFDVFTHQNVIHMHYHSPRTNSDILKGTAVGTVIFILVVAVLIIAMIGGISQRGNDKQMLQSMGIPESEVNAWDISVHGPLNTEMVCPHCQTKGRVMSKKIDKKAGISGAKATGAILTGGVSLLATGLARKDSLTEAYCGKCKSQWHF